MMKNELKPFVSIISPVFQAEDFIDQLVDSIILHITPLAENYEIILIEDGSNDDSWEKIKSICLSNDKVKGIHLSRNFGQHNAITAGLEFCRGEWIIIMDCDMQDRPDQFFKFFEASNQGFEVIQAKRITRQDPWIKKAYSHLFYHLLSYLTGIKQNADIANFGMYHRQVIDAINKMGESIRYFPSQINWVGFRRIEINVDHGISKREKSSYSVGKKLDLAIDVMISYSDKPLRLTIKLGLFISILSVVYAMYNVFLYFNGDITVPGFASLIVSIWFLSGLIIFILGMIGLYLAQVFKNVKNRPIYLVREKLNIVESQ